MLDRGGVGEPGVRAAQVLGDVRVPQREAAHVQLVDDGVRPWDVGRRGRRPSRSRRATTTERGTNGAESRSSRTVSSAPPAAWPSTPSSRRSAPSIARAYGSSEQLGRVEAVAVPRGPRARARGSRSAGPAPTPGTCRARPCVRSVSGYPRLAPVVVEQAQLHRLAAAPHRERRAAVVGVAPSGGGPLAALDTADLLGSLGSSGRGSPYGSAGPTGR